MRRSSRGTNHHNSGLLSKLRVAKAHTPYDYFEREGYQKYQLRGANDDESYRKALRICHYWWRFEKDGYTFAPIRSLPYPFPAPSAGEPAIIDFSGGEFPSVELHLQLLLHALRQSDYEPTEAWISHVREHPGALLPELQKATQHNPRLTPAHHVVVKAEFGIRDNLSEREWAQVLGQIMARV